MESTPRIQPDTSPVKGKTATQKPKKSCGKTARYEEAEAHLEKHCHHGLAVAATTVRLWWALAGHAPPLLERRVLCFALDCRSCLGSFILGILGLFLLALMTLSGLIFMLFFSHLT